MAISGILGFAIVVFVWFAKLKSAQEEARNAKDTIEDFEEIASDAMDGIANAVDNINNTIYDERTLAEAEDPMRMGNILNGSKKAAKSGRLDSVSFFLEDRKNDWMAKQLKEEAKILHSGDLMDLGANHAKNCAADDLKKSHRLFEHDSSIDTGRARR